MKFKVRSGRLGAPLRFVFLILFPTVQLLGLPAIGQATMQASTGPAIISPTHPKDSRGEVVYVTQGESEKDKPVVPGVFVCPSPISTPQPKYPKALKKARSAADVTVIMVITQDGDAIDATVVDSSDQDSSSSALAAIRKYRFKPATLDGKPVASLVRVVVAFRIR